MNEMCRAFFRNIQYFKTFKHKRANYEVNDADIRRNNILQNVRNSTSTTVRPVGPETGTYFKIYCTQNLEEK